MKKLNSFLSDIQYEHYNNKLLNVLQLGDFGFLLVDVKQKFIDTGIIIKKKKLNKIDIQLSQEEIEIIKIALEVYWKILVGDFSVINKITRHNIDKSFNLKLQEAGKIATDLASDNYIFSISEKFINRKAKWAFDICQSFDNKDNNDIIKNMGTLPKLKITKNG